jgi:dynein heavy chain, axonemal
MEIAVRYFQGMLDEMGGNYDPGLLGKQNQIYIDPSEWPESVVKRVDVSLSRYHHYIHSDLIRQHEIPKYKKEWMVKAFSLISEELISNEVCAR